MAKVWVRRWIREGLDTLGGSGSARQIIASHHSLQGRSENQIHAMLSRMGYPKERINGAVVYSVPVPA